MRLQEALSFGLTHQAIQRWIFVSISKNKITGVQLKAEFYRKKLEYFFVFGNNLEEALVSWVMKTGAYRGGLTYVAPRDDGK